MDGEVVGINTAIVSKSGSYNGVGLTIPSNLVETVATKLINHGFVERGFLGAQLGDLRKDWVQILKLPKDTTGVIALEVIDDSPAKKSGLETNDIIIKIDDKNIKDALELSNTIGLLTPGTKIKLTVYRKTNNKYKLHNISIKVGVRPDTRKPDSHKLSGQAKSAKNLFGIQVKDISSNQNLRKKYSLQTPKGAVITGIDENSLASRSGLKVGDAITHFNLVKITSAQSLRKSLEKTKPGETIILNIERKGQTFIIELRSKK